MNWLVCISKTPETTAPVAFENENTVFRTDGVNFIMNPYDEWYALVRAIELKEKHGGKVTVINVGLADADIIIRKALAIGADEAVRVNMEPMSAFSVAVQIAGYAKDKNFAGILLGKETIDFNGSEVGAMLAALMDLPYFSYASRLEHDGSKATVTRDIEGGVEVAELEGPFVLSAAKGLAEQRIPNMRGIMMAKRKPLEVIEPMVTKDRVSVVNFELPAQKTGVKMVDPENMDELVKLLKEEAKVI